MSQALIVLAFVAVGVAAFALGRRSLSHSTATESRRNVIRPRPNTRVTPHELLLPTIQQGEPPESVQSDSDSSVIYSVDPSRLTCTCPDFQRRVALPVTSFERCCKHLLRVLYRRGFLASASEWEQAIAADGYGAPAEAWLITLDSAPAVLVTVAANKVWVNVYARTLRSGERIGSASGPIQRFGWNVDEDRWAYGEGPPGSRELTPLMKEVL
jgi:hypothetical protein